MTEAVQHHTVPAGYLSGFLAQGETLLHVYTRDGKHFRGKPESLSSRRYYHSVQRDDGTRDNTIEGMLAEDVEGPGIAALRKLANREQLSQVERARLCIYMAIQILRTPHMRDNFEKSFEAMLNYTARRIMTKNDPQELAAVLAEKNRMEPKAAERLAREAKGAYLRGQIKLEVKPELSLASVFEHCDVYAEAMANWKWEVVASSTTDFITSDCPVHFVDKRHLALMDPETTFHFPLSSKALLVMQFAEREDRLWEKLSRIIPDRYLAGFRVWHNYISYREIGAGEVDKCNRITASMAEKNIYLGSETEALNTILAEPSQNVRLRITAVGNELRMDLKAGDSGI